MSTNRGQGLFATSKVTAGSIICFDCPLYLASRIKPNGKLRPVEKKKKEIAIRKALGASSFSILGSLIRELFVLIAAAGLLSFPLAYFYSKKWLQSFAYRTKLDVWVFALAALIIVLIALASVAKLTIRAARANPAISLKNEG